MGKGLELHQGRHTNSQQTCAKLLNVTTCQGMQIKTTARDHPAPARMAMEETKTVSDGEGVGKSEPFYTTGGKVK